MSSKTFYLILFAALGLITASTTAHAADGTWTNLGGGSWTDTANWSGGIVADGADSTADFSTLDLTSAHVYVNLDGDRTIGNMLFEDSPWTHSWLLVPGTGGTLTMETTTGTPTIDAASRAYMQTVLGGTQGFTKTGAGELEWNVLGSAYNTITGPITVAEGILKLIKYDSSALFFDTPTALPSFTVENGAKLYVKTRNPFSCNGPDGWDYIPVTLNGGSLETSSKDLFLDDITMDVAQSTIVNANDAKIYVGSSSTLWTVTAAASGSTVSGSSPLTFYTEQEDWAFELNVARGTAAADLTISSVLEDHYTMKGLSVLKTGDGILALTEANTYAGDTKVEGGTLSISNPYLCNFSDVYIDTGACLDLGFTGSDTISELYIDGEAAELGTWGAVGSAADHTSSLITGTGILNVVGEPIPGDANVDGYVDTNDAAILAANWLKTGTVLWGDGDFNDDGTVDDIDATMMATNWNPAPSSAVPEPGTIALLLTAVLAIATIRRK